MTSPANPAEQSWSVLGPEAPDDLAGRRALAIGADPEAPAAALEERGAAVVRWKFPGEPLAAGDPFDLVCCAGGAMQGDPHPVNLLTRIWHLTRAGSALLLESQVLTAPEASRYGLFVADPDDGARSHWLPGRLALRWMVEVTGFDVDRWLDGEEDAGSDRATAYLRATRTDRAPALDLANPHHQEGGS
ncbi:MAG TPA: hypothetical protein VK889_08515 [Solirubrobacterales bacterium]|nr:hypothetical protein [Solirubrobacterales bacterium]